MLALVGSISVLGIIAFVLVREAPEPEWSINYKPGILLKVDRLDYSSGYLTVIGRAKNVGTRPAFSPTIVVKLYDKATGQTLLAQASSWPVGQLGRNMPPGMIAAFEHIVRVPGEPRFSDLTFTIRVKDYPFARTESLTHP